MTTAELESLPERTIDKLSVFGFRIFKNSVFIFIGGYEHVWFLKMKNIF